MATMNQSGAMSEEPVSPCVWPTFESVKDTVRGARRAVGAARHATESLTADTAVKVRLHPLRAVGIATFAGAVAGALVGFGFGWFARTRV